MNPVRLRYVEHAARPAARRVLDVGCGGGLLTEGMCRMGARVTGIDASAAAIDALPVRAGGLWSGISARCPLTWL